MKMVPENEISNLNSHKSLMHLSTDLSLFLKIKVKKKY